MSDLITNVRFLLDTPLAEGESKLERDEDIARRVPELLDVLERVTAERDQARAESLRHIAENNELLEVARQAIEEAVIDFRDSGIFVLRNNGLVCKTRDGKDSHIIRFGPELAVSIGLRAIADKLAIAEEAARTEAAAVIGRVLDSLDPVREEEMAVKLDDQLADVNRRTAVDREVFAAAEALVGRMKQAVGDSLSSASQWLDEYSYRLYAAVDARAALYAPAAEEVES